ncbi:MAG: molybdate ABC transporter substrate-binding protein [Planctomycetes bacterium]|nr:molybdate ABC transporter substrate-binding protein [Planctomycetota bacterium]
MTRLAALLLALVPCACGRPEGEVILLAAASLEPHFAPLLAQRSGVRVAYGASGALARQMEQGVPAEVVILADARDGEHLVQQGVLEEGSLVPFLQNRLVLISARPELRSRRLALEDLAAAPFARIAVGDPDLVPVGRYTLEALEAKGLLEQLRPRLVPLQTVRAVWSAVTVLACDAGFVYATDVTEAEQAQILCEVDPALHRPIVFVIGLRREASPAARALYQELRSPAVLARLTGAGFLRPRGE